MDAGVDSVSAANLVDDLNRAFGLNFVATVFFECSTPRIMSQHIDDQLRMLARTNEQDAASTDVLSSSVVPVHTAHGTLRRVSAWCSRWPASPRPAFYLCAAAGDALGEVPSRRWTHDEAFGSVSLTEYQRQCVRHGGYVAAHTFDNAWFRLSRSEAHAMDPQQRLLLDLGYGALHAWGERMATLGGASIGHAAAIVRADWFRLRVFEQGYSTTSAYNITADTCSVASGRLSFQLGLHGPAVSIDTACSSSLSALHVALRTADQSCVLSAVRLELAPQHTLDAAGAAMLSRHGRCFTLDARADGYVSAEAACAAVLVGGGSTCGTAADAGVVRSQQVDGSRVSQDGRSASLTAPNGAAQRCMIAPLHITETPSERTWLELHGTGTALGDPTETSALLSALGGVCRVLQIGGAKANAGHTMAASGSVGMEKLMEQRMRGVLCANAHLRRLNRLVLASAGSAACPVIMNTQSEAARATTTHKQDERGGVSSFGYSGTIAHAVFAGGASAFPSLLLDVTRKQRMGMRRVSFEWTPRTSAAGSPNDFYTMCWSAAAEASLPDCGTRVCHVVDAAGVSTEMGRSIEGTASVSNERTWLVVRSDCELAPALELHALLPFLLASSLKVGIVTDGVFHVRLSESNALVHGAASGLVHALRKEHPKAEARLVDACTGENMSPTESMRVSDNERTVCLRGGERDVARLRRSSRRHLGESACVTMGAGVVTGGLGGLGLRTALNLSINGARLILLTSRSGTVPRDGQGLAEHMRQAMRRGDIALACDGCDSDETRALGTTLARAGAMPVTLVHAAGVTHTQPLRETTRRDAAPIYASKAVAALHVHRTTLDRPMHAFVSMSSLSSFWCRSGQGAYGGANAYLDRHAERRRATGTRATAFALPGVEEVGMGAAIDVQRTVTLALTEYDAMLRSLIVDPRERSAAIVMPSDLRGDAGNSLFDTEDARNVPSPSVACMYIACARDVRRLALVASDLPAIVEVGGNVDEWWFDLVAHRAAVEFGSRQPPWVIVERGEARSLASPAARGTPPLLDILRGKATVRVQYSTSTSADAATPSYNILNFKCAKDAVEYVRTLTARWSIAAPGLLTECASRLPALDLPAAYVAMGMLYPPEPRKSARRLVRLRFDRRRGIAVLSLNDPDRSNTLSHDLASDVHHAALRLRSEVGALRCIVLQGEGEHFSVGVNPFNYASNAPKPFVALVYSCDRLLAGFVELRRLGVPVVCAVHGKLIGAALAAALNADHVVAAASATFQHGNLVRGVCPLGLLSRTLVQRIGRRGVLEMYLTNDAWSAERAKDTGMVQEVLCDAATAQRRALEIACEVAYDAARGDAMLGRRDAVDEWLIHHEAVGHARCLADNGGRYATSAVQTYAESAGIAAEVQRAPPTDIHVEDASQQRSPAHRVGQSHQVRLPSVLTDEAMSDILAWPEDGLLCVRGESEREFCLGGNPSEDRLTSGDFLRDVEKFAALHEKMGRVQSIVVCRGSVRGFGMLFPCSGTHVVAYADATFGFPEIRRGVLPGVVSIAARKRLTVEACRWLFCTADVIDAQEALRIGLVDEVVDEAHGCDVVEARMSKWCTADGSSCSLRDVARCSLAEAGARCNSERTLVVVGPRDGSDAFPTLPLTTRVVILYDCAMDGPMMRNWLPSGVAALGAWSKGPPKTTRVHRSFCTTEHERADVVADDPLHEALCFANWLLSHPARGIREVLSLVDESE